MYSTVYTSTHTYKLQVMRRTEECHSYCTPLAREIKTASNLLENSSKDHPADVFQGPLVNFIRRCWEV